jgi:SapC
VVVAHLYLRGAKVLNLTDFQVVDEAALNALGNDDYLKLRELGALAMVYCHLEFFDSWNALAYQATLRKAQEASS